MSQQKILDGVRVLDFSRYIAGPYCAALLGWLGADVIRIDKPGGGEDRFVGPVGDEYSAVFVKTGFNKRSLTLDLKHEQAPEIIERLVKDADVVIVNMPPKVLARMGLDYDTLSAINPGIVLTTQTCFGHKGPWANRGGFDGIGQVMSGNAYLSGFPNDPRRAAAPYVDYSTAVLGALGTVSALWQRQATGKGQHVQASLLGSAFGVFAGPLIEQAAVQANRIPLGNRGQTSAPTDLFKAKDGSLITQVVGKGLFSRIAKVVGHEEWCDDPRFVTDEQRGEHRDEICDTVAAWVAERTVDEALDALSEAGVPCGPVLSLEDAIHHPQVEGMGLMHDVDLPGVSHATKGVRMPLDFSDYEPPRERPPQIGEHSESVLGEAGYSPAEVESLRQSGAI